MNVINKTLRTGTAAVLLCAGMTAGAYGLVPTGGSPASGTSRGVLRITGTILCRQCNLDDIRNAQPQMVHVYELTHKQGQVVMEVTQVNDPHTMIDLAYPPRLQVRTPDSVFARLTAEENLRKEVEITGLLNTAQMLDIFDVTIRG